MDILADANWWQFSVEAETRYRKIIGDASGLTEINPPLPDGRHLLDYHAYIGLDKLLSCQAPSSMVPDERCFIITHQLCELVFKLMIFDLTVVARTLRQLLESSCDDLFVSLCTTSEDDDFWLPALTSSGRISYSSSVLLPALIGYLLNAEDKDGTFSSREFLYFREYLPPASGFQSAQFRLIQRAFGKSPLLSIKLYPAGDYRRSYEVSDDPTPTHIVDPIILRQDTGVACPEGSMPFAEATQLDDYAHKVLARLACSASDDPAQEELAKIEQDEIHQVVQTFRRLLAHYFGSQDSTSRHADARIRAASTMFQDSFERAAQAENRRRSSFKSARAGSIFLHNAAPQSQLAQILNRLVFADNALYGTHGDSFISLHYQLARDRIQELSELQSQLSGQAALSGTGGGGVPYLGFMRKNLLPLFPALVAYADLKDQPQLQYLERGA